MIQLQIGEEQVRNYSARLLAQLLRVEERFGLDIAEMEVLTHWVSTATASHSQNISELRQTLMSGLKELSMIILSRALEDAVLESMLMAQEGVRYAVFIRKPGKPARVIMYLGR